MPREERVSTGESDWTAGRSVAWNSVPGQTREGRRLVKGETQPVVPGHSVCGPATPHYLIQYLFLMSGEMSGRPHTGLHLTNNVFAESTELTQILLLGRGHSW